MSRPLLALLLLLGLTSAGAGQSASPTVWTLASGDFTIYGHTSYTPTLVLIPRIVFDTARGVDSARVMDSVRLARIGHAGLAAGLTAWPTDFYCGGVSSGSMLTVEPRDLLDRVRVAARCGVRLVLVPPRRLLTADGRPKGAFSVDSAKRLTDHYAAALPPDSLYKYRATLLGLNLADDYKCTTCWGGKTITRAQIAEWAAYARTRLPGLPLGVRVTPDWVAAAPALAPLLDYAWAQYDTKRGEPQTYYDNAATIADQLGLRLVMGLNVEDCHGVSTSPCGAADLIRIGTIAVSHPASCAFLNWKYAEATWQQIEVRDVWDDLLAMAKARPARECRRAEGGG